MPFNPNIHHRQSIRLKGYDYTQVGPYFVTICAHERECLFGEVVKGEMVLNAFGKIVGDYWQALPHHFEQVQLDAFVLMPNHLHGLILINGEVKRPNSSSSSGTTRHSLSAIIQNYKSVSTRKVNQEREVSGWHVWQRNYYEHIVRNGADLKRIRKYVAENVLKWGLDQLNPKNGPDRDMRLLGILEGEHYLWHLRGRENRAKHSPIDPHFKNRRRMLRPYNLPS